MPPLTSKALPTTLTAAGLLLLPPSQRDQFWASLTPKAKADLAYRWSFWARPEQLAPAGDWLTWLVQAGRGFGKTRTGAEWIRDEVESGRRNRLALIGPTAADVRDVMVEGESGLLRCCPPWNRPTYEPSKRRITWANGAMATTYSADEPERLRGPQHDGGWCDEPASWRHPETWDMYQFGLRLGTAPRTVVTGTPKPVKLIRALVADTSTYVTRGRTTDNAANLAPSFLKAVLAKYQGTRLGRQELDAEILDDNPGALWTRERIETARLTHVDGDLTRVVIGVDPAVTANADSDETGILAVGARADHGYVLGDYSLIGTPLQWASEVVRAYHLHHADYVIAEANNGGDLVRYTINTVDASVPVKLVHASRGKVTRAEPVAALYEQGRISHVGTFPQLEDQQCEWVPTSEDSPDRVDALVWGLSELLVQPVGDYSLLDW